MCNCGGQLVASFFIFSCPPPPPCVSDQIDPRQHLPPLPGAAATTATAGGTRGCGGGGSISGHSDTAADIAMAIRSAGARLYSVACSCSCWSVCEECFFLPLLSLSLMFATRFCSKKYLLLIVSISPFPGNFFVNRGSRLFCSVVVSTSPRRAFQER